MISNPKIKTAAAKNYLILFGLFLFNFIPTAHAIMGSSTNYQLEIADITNGGSSGSSTNYDLELGVIGDNADGSSISHNYQICSGLAQEAFASCDDPAPPPPPEPPEPPIPPTPDDPNVIGAGGPYGDPPFPSPPDDPLPPIDPETPAEPQQPEVPTQPILPVPSEQPIQPETIPTTRPVAPTIPYIAPSSSDYNYLAPTLRPSYEINYFFQPDLICYGDQINFSQPWSDEDSACWIVTCVNQAVLIIEFLYLLILLILIVLISAYNLYFIDKRANKNS